MRLEYRLRQAGPDSVTLVRPTGAVAAALGRHFVLVDQSEEAIAVIRARLERSGVTAEFTQT